MYLSSAVVWMLNLLLMYLNLTTYFASMKNMEKNLLTCWMACSLLFSSTPGTKASLQLGMLSVLRHYIWAGVLMVINFFSFLYLLITLYSCTGRQFERPILHFPFRFINCLLYCRINMVCFRNESFE